MIRALYRGNEVGTCHVTLITVGNSWEYFRLHQLRPTQIKTMEVGNWISTKTVVIEA